MKKQDARSRSLVTWVLVILLLVAFAALLILVARPALADAPNPSSWPSSATCKPDRGW